LIAARTHSVHFTAPPSALRSSADAISFDHYHKGDAAYETTIWLAESLLMLMYQGASGSFLGVPIHHIASIECGVSTHELKARVSRTVMCCIAVEDPEFAAKAPLLFSLLLVDGRTLDFEASTPSVRDEWVSRLRSLLSSASSFVAYHFALAQYPLAALIKRETERLSPENMKRILDATRATNKAARNGKSDGIRQKYAAKK
jgi:hypothetical protein